jgi:hypothetical protein
VRLTGGAVTVSQKPNGSVTYTKAAQRLAARAVALDNLAEWDALDAAGKQEREDQLLELSLAAVLTAYCAVEAVVNELYCEPTWFPGLSDSVSRRLANTWQSVTRLTSPIAKADIALSVAGIARPTDFWGTKAPQQLTLLNSLRNALVHHEPYEWVSGTVDPLETKLQNSFPRALIWQARNPGYRWAGCLGGRGAQWASQTARAFQDEFFALLGCTYPASNLSR